MKDIAFKLLKYWTTKPKSYIEEIVDDFFVKNNITEDHKEEVLTESKRMIMEVLFKGGIINDKNIVGFDTFDEYLNSIVNNRIKNRKLVQEKWIDERPARKFFVQKIPKTKDDEILFDKQEECAEIIKEYWDNDYFNEKEVTKQLICICERDYGGENRIGIFIKKEPNAHQFRIIVRGIIGPYNVANEGNKGWSLELEKGAERFCLSKTYNYFPTKDDVIDDFVCLELLEQQPPIGQIITDTSKFPIYPTAKEYFKK